MEDIEIKTCPFCGKCVMCSPAEPPEDDFDGLTWDQLTALFDDLVRERGKVAEILEDAEND